MSCIFPRFPLYAMLFKSLIVIPRCGFSYVTLPFFLFFLEPVVGSILDLNFGEENDVTRPSPPRQLPMQPMPSSAASSSQFAANMMLSPTTPTAAANAGANINNPIPVMQSTRIVSDRKMSSSSSSNSGSYDALDFNGANHPNLPHYYTK